MMHEGHYEKFQAKMAAAGLTKCAQIAFEHNYKQLVAGATGMVPEAEIDPVSSLPKLEALPEANMVELKGLLSETVVLKLNGGLGTSMGLEKAKSLLRVKDGLNFLDLITLQVKHMRAAFGSKVVFTLMNSFSTSKDTRDHLQSTPEAADLLNEPFIELMQNMSPKVDAATLEPVTYPANPELEWCPPGHGDIYSAIMGSTMLKQLVDSGKKYMFVSNSDNLGATLDLQLLSYFAHTGKSFLMEVCQRTAADKKGGHLCTRKADGKFMLRESAMCPKEDASHFEDIGKHQFFNTNNLWLNLVDLQKEMEAHGGMLKLPLIVNKKTVNPRDNSSTAVFQLETAMGSAIECFDNAGAVIVPRSRFAPVKTCADLLLLRSDAYRLAENATVEAVVPEMPLIDLDAHYKLVDQLEALIPPGSEPSLIGAKSLKVHGPVAFAKGVVIKGATVIEAEQRTELAGGEYTGNWKLGVLILTHFAAA